MNTLARDFGYAVRMLAKSPGFTLAAILSLAIGIGANTSIFSLVNALLLRPLQYPDANRLVILWNRSPGLNITEDWFSTAQYFDIKTGHHGFEQVAIAIGGNDNLTSQGEPERVGTIRVSSNLLPMLGQAAALGRVFAPDEDSPGKPATAVLSYGMWLRHFGGDPRMIGKSVTLNGVSYEVVGIMPRAFSLPLEKSCPLSTEPSRPISSFRCRCRSVPRKTATTKTTTSWASSSLVFPLPKPRPRWIPSRRDCATIIRGPIRPTAA